MTTHFEAFNQSFPRDEKAFKFPKCIFMKLDRPQNLKGIDFGSLQNLDTLEISYTEIIKPDLQNSEQ